MSKPPKAAGKPATPTARKEAGAPPQIPPEIRVRILEGTLAETRQQLSAANASAAEARTAAIMNGEAAKAEKARADKAEAELAKLKGEK